MATIPLRWQGKLILSQIATNFNLTIDHVRLNYWWQAGFTEEQYWRALRPNKHLKLKINTKLLLIPVDNINMR